jgi:mannose-6-phosphate isomerase
MTSLYPLVFHPLFKERVWGGRTLAALYRKPLPPEVPVGESWEIADRPGDESVVANGAFAGRTLRWLMEHHARELLGNAAVAPGGRFPILCKILDARDRLSLQVHPRADTAASPGEPKTEMWYVAAADPDAELYVGLRHGVTREAFEEGIRAGRVAQCFHRIRVTAGDTMFLPSGRVHAIGAGLVIFEIQQNSDTTFRVYDWDRMGLDGKPRDLHIAESLASIDFSDVEPALAGGDTTIEGLFTRRALVRHQLFDADVVRATARSVLTLRPPRLRIVAVVERQLVVNGGGVGTVLAAGQFCLIPASVPDATLTAQRGSQFLIVEAGDNLTP